MSRTEAAEHSLKKTTRTTRIICIALAILDLFLGGAALFFPKLYLLFMQPGALDDPTYLIQRTGTVWLVFSAVQFIAFFKTPRWRAPVLVVAGFRLMEVPADPVYLLTARGLGNMGVLGLAAAPILNLVVGTYLLLAWRKMGLVNHADFGT
jgi:hypothetical protein